MLAPLEDTIGKFCCVVCMLDIHSILLLAIDKSRWSSVWVSCFSVDVVTRCIVIRNAQHLARYIVSLAESETTARERDEEKWTHAPRTTDSNSEAYEIAIILSAHVYPRASRRFSWSKLEREWESLEASRRRENSRQANLLWVL